MTPTDFKDVAAGCQSVAIVLATILGGGWALYQFFSLRALESARLALERAKRELVEQASLVIDLVTESFVVDGQLLLHVRVAMRNEGSGVEIVDWGKAQLFVRSVQKGDRMTLEQVGDVLYGWHPPSLVGAGRHLIGFRPGGIAREAFLVVIPQAGVYHVEFSIPTSQAAMADSMGEIARTGASGFAKGVVRWEARGFVSVPAVLQPGAPAG